jgi:predicted O-linked N-acetylglucosamine transferase (SPINDLY family)
LQEAEGRYARILAQEPGNILARYHQGLARLQRGNLEGGINVLQRVIQHAPDHVEAHFNLGRAHLERKRPAEALAHFQRVVALAPNVTEGHFYLGLTLAQLGRHTEAVPFFEQAIALRPKLPEAEFNLGSALNDLGRHQDAVAHFERALALRPGFAEAHNGLGNALLEGGSLAAALRQFKQAAQLRPNFAEAHNGLGQVLLRLGQLEVAQGQFEQAVTLMPDFAEAHLGLGQLLCRWGRYDEGLAHMERAVAEKPDMSSYLGSVLFHLHYHPGLAAAEVASRHRAFGERFGGPLKPGWQPHANVPDPERVLRVGFVSGDFRRHSVGYFMADLLPGLRAAGLELYAYANQRENDDMTDRIKPQFAMWRECGRLSDEELAAQIRADGIDVLVDLSGHTDGNRLMVFARKPAPVQVTYLGYPDTTGLAAVDYILGDSRMLTQREETLYVEKAWRLPDTSLCFMPPDLPVEVGPLPAAQNGCVTFGCLNKREKINDAVIEAWAKILQAVPGSRLLLQNKPYGDLGIATHVRSRFAERGIEADRLELIGRVSWREHMEIYNRLDIALDPFPYNGTTTSVEGLWMGVPLLALKGDRLAAHMGESILHAVNMTDWIAADEDGYVTKAVAFANDLPALVSLRAGLRDRLLASPICDAPRFARNLEEAFRGMWRAWCEQQPPPKHQ